MFYLELTDGSKYFTSPDSDDRLEFDKIIAEKLGADASDIFNSLISEASDITDRQIQEIIQLCSACISELSDLLCADIIDADRLSTAIHHLCELRDSLSS